MIIFQSFAGGKGAAESAFQRMWIRSIKQLIDDVGKLLEA